MTIPKEKIPQPPLRLRRAAPRREGSVSKGPDKRLANAPSTDLLFEEARITWLRDPLEFPCLLETVHRGLSTYNRIPLDERVVGFAVVRAGSGILVHGKNYDAKRFTRRVWETVDDNPTPGEIVKPSSTEAKKRSRFYVPPES